MTPEGITTTQPQITSGPRPRGRPEDLLGESVS